LPNGLATESITAVIEAQISETMAIMG
jgi:hypothetical protein